MTAGDLAALVDFHYWARDRVLDATAGLTPEQLTRDLGNSFTSVRDTLVHIYWAEWAWYQIWHGSFPAAPLNVEGLLDLESIRRTWRDHEVKVRAFITALGDGDAERVVEFRRPDGTAGAFPIAHMVQHLVNHGTYHRGQLTMMLRLLGTKPPEGMDLIRYYRDQQVGAARRA